MPSSVRAAAVCRNDGWNTCAKQNVMPTSVASSATRAGGWSSRMPSSSSTSAEPDDDDAARLPCLTTVMPAPAMTRADIVEMFTVCERSPPVPTMSSVRPGTSMRTACASIVSARPVSSATVSPLVLQRDEERGDLGRRRRAAHDLGHRPRRLLGR